MSAVCIPPSALFGFGGTIARKTRAVKAASRRFLTRLIALRGLLLNVTMADQTVREREQYELGAGLEAELRA